MPSELPYSKREQDEFRRENKEQYDRIMEAMRNQNVILASIKSQQVTDSKVVEKLCITTSENSGAITQLWESHKLIKDVAAFSKVTKWIFGSIIAAGVIYSTFKLFIQEYLKYLIR